MVTKAMVWPRVAIHDEAKAKDYEAEAWSNEAGIFSLC